MSHLAERTEKNCLNCGTTVLGRYCQDCGQENIEPKETVLHLVTHFVGDLFHFDGKFFSTLKYLMFRPGFLPVEYVRGRRMSYLHPIRMYVFTSFIFFVCLEAKLSSNIGESKDGTTKVVSVMRQREAMLKAEQDTVKDPSRKEEIRDSLTDLRDAINDLKIAGEFSDSATSAKDSVAAAGAQKTAGGQGTQKTVDGEGTKKADDDDETYVIVAPPPGQTKTTMTGFGGVQIPRTVEAYDSLVAHTPPEKRQGWLLRVLNRKVIQIQVEHHADRKRFNRELWEHIQETFPKILFVSLPLFALFLRLLNLRRRKRILYVDHGIFTIHLYCATFIVMLVMMLISVLENWTGWGWLDWIIWLLFLVPFFYEYKAMRAFYQQGRGKTILKFLLLNTAAMLTVGIVTAIFVLWAVFQV